MSFTIYTNDGMKIIQWFKKIDELIDSMINNPLNRYHRNV